jgi:hypothetical protein
VHRLGFALASLLYEAADMQGRQALLVADSSAARLRLALGALQKVRLL